jgi:oxygen-independent coproporphyrinogen-3 oxidase
MNQTDPGFGIYIHWPFCKAKCPYCDFNSHVNRAIDPSIFADGLVKELSYMRELSGPRALTSIFFGGGTPSLMPPAVVNQILNQIDNLWSIPDLTEITLEANPTSIEGRNFEGYRQAGVNRVSVGVQALNDKDLARLGREHSSQEALEAYRLARKIFPRTSFDLIYARPNQTQAEWEKELKLALYEEPDHLSLYQLTIEEGTPFYNLHATGKLKVPSDDYSADLYDLTQEITTAHGFRTYEVSNHARPGDECRHNLVYWRYGDYVGVGPGAHGRLTINNEKISTYCTPEPNQWLQKVNQHNHAIVDRQILSKLDQAHEYLLMGLRLSEGISLSRYASYSNRTISENTLNELIEDNLILISGDMLRTTSKGRPMLNAIISKLASL